MKVEDLDTPVVTIDLDIMEANIARLQAYCDAHGLTNRPHIKTHKIPAIAHKQVAAGAAGICCQKVGEAEVMAAGGLRDILITFPLLGAPKLERLMRLTHQAKVRVVADSPECIRGISQAAAAEGATVPIFVECDTGFKRTGVQTPEEALDLARLILDLSGVAFAGLMTYPTLPSTGPWLHAAKELFAKKGIPVEAITSGGTPGAFQTHEVPEITELRAGTYLYNDRNCMARKAATVEQCAMRIIATVASRPHPDRAILDAGSKTLSNDPVEPAAGKGFGLILEYPEAVIEKQSEEHGHVDLSACARKPKVGERVTIIPNHTCQVTNLHDEVVGVRKGRVEVVWPVLARGKIR
ncbi:MAG: D-TA family PLP-dependent enzyme [Armatimonadetes bacterium]|nr:D-TA family PLP-dependent enzyme [Armatimonadota bacterium]